MKDLDLGALENVAGGLALQGIASGAVTGTNPTVGTPTSPLPNTGVQPFGGEPFGSFGGFGGGGGWGGGWGGGEFGGFGGGHHHGLGHEAMREFVHDPSFQGALQQFEQQHPELAASFAPLQNGEHHGIWQVMHDPNGRAALDQFMHDGSFANAFQQFASTHPDLAGPLAHMVMRTEYRIENGGPQGYGGYGYNGGYGQFAPVQGVDPYAQTTSPTAQSGIGIDPASIGLPSTF